MAKARFRSDASEAIHSAASGLYRAKVIDKKTMREYDDLCIEKAPEFDAKKIARIRKGVNVSQGVLVNNVNHGSAGVSLCKPFAGGEFGLYGQAATQNIQICRRIISPLQRTDTETSFCLESGTLKHSGSKLGQQDIVPTNHNTSHLEMFSYDQTAEIRHLLFSMVNDQIRNSIEAVVNLLFLIKVEAENPEAVRSLVDMSAAPVHHLLEECRNDDNRHHHQNR